MSARKIRQKTASGRPLQQSAKSTSTSGRSTSSFVGACIIGVGAAAALSYTGLYDFGSGIGVSVIERLMGKENVFEGIPPQAVVSLHSFLIRTCSMSIQRTSVLIGWIFFDL